MFYVTLFTVCYKRFHTAMHRSVHKDFCSNLWLWVAEIAELLPRQRGGLWGPSWRQEEQGRRGGHGTGGDIQRGGGKGIPPYRPLVGWVTCSQWDLSASLQPSTLPSVWHSEIILVKAIIIVIIVERWSSSEIEGNSSPEHCHQSSFLHLNHFFSKGPFSKGH